jgi:hypothetical protein
MHDGAAGVDGATGSDAGTDGTTAAVDASVGDPTFGDGGGVTNWPPTPDGGPALYRIWAIAVRPDGRIVVVMEAGVRAWEVGQLLADGSAFDPTFGSGGTVLLPATSTISTDNYYAGGRVALTPGGNIVVSYGCPASNLNGALSNTCVTRLTANGSIDTTFGTAGTVEYNSLSLGAQPSIKSIVVEANDQIWFTGAWYNINGNVTGTAFIGGLDSSGNPFNGQGWGIVGGIGGSDCIALGVQSTGRLLALCANPTGFPPVLVGVSPTTVTYDTTFGQQGTVNLPAGTPGGMTVRGDDSILVVESVAVGSSTGFGAVRLSPSGALVGSFGDAGTLTVGTPGALTLVGAAALARVDYAAGMLANDGGTQLVALKVLDAGLDPAYGAGGIGIVQNPGWAWAMNVESAGVLIGGDDRAGHPMLVRALP